MENIQNQENYKFVKLSKNNFIDYCNTAFELLKNMDNTKLSVAKIAGSKLALRRMLGLFVDQEDFEKCIYIKKFLEDNFEGNNNPLHDYRQL